MALPLVYQRPSFWLQGVDPIIVDDGSITSVSCFCYLGSLVESHCGVQLQLNTRISRAATSAFGTVETWHLKRRALETFHHLCLRTLLDISRAKQIS